MADAQLTRVLRHIRRLVHARVVERQSDALLLARFASRRDETAFAALVERHGPMVFSVCRRVLGAGPDAEDAFQATFLLLARQAKSIRKRESLGSWLHGVACRIAMKAKVAAARRRVHERKSGQETRFRQEARFLDPGLQAAWRELQAALDLELNALPERYRTPLVLCYLEGLTQEEAAGQLGCPAGTVKSRLARARDRLRSRLARRGLSLAAGPFAVVLAATTASAAVPAALGRNTVEGALLIAGGKALAASAAAPVAALVDAATKSVSVMKLKMAALLLVGLCVLGVGAGAITQRASTAKEPEAQRADEPQAIAQGSEAAKKEQPKPEEPKRSRTDRYGDPLPEGAIARLGTVRMRHGAATAIAFAPDGKSLLTYGSDKAVRSWNLDTGQSKQPKPLPVSFIDNQAELSPDGKILAGCEWDTLCVCDVASGRVERIPLPEKGGGTLVFAPDGRSLAVGHWKGNLYLYELASKQFRLLGKHGRSIVEELAFSSDGRRLAALSLDATSCWEVTTRKEVFVHRQDNSTRYSLSFSADGRTLTWVTVVGEKIEFCDATTGRPDQRWQTPPFQGVIAVAFAPDGQTLAVGTQHGVILWDLAKAKTRRELTGGNAGGLQFSANGRRLASRCGRWHYPQVLQVWEVATGQPLPPRGTPAGHRGEVNVVAFSPDGRSLASASSTDNSVRLWDVAERRLIHIWRSSVHNHHHLAFSPSGDRLFSGGGRHDIRAWNTITGREQASLSLHEPGKDKQAWWAVNNMRLSADGQTLAAVCFESPDKPGVLTSVALWDVASGKRLLRRREHFNYLPTTFWPGEISPDAKTWAILDGKLKDVATGAERRALTAGLWIGDPYAFSADGLLVAGALSQPFEIKEPLQRRPGGPIEAAQVWETATGQPLARLKTGHIGYMTFAPDGRSLLTADDKAIRLWDAITGKVLWQQPAHAAYRDSKRGSFVSSLAVSPDGRTVATGLIDSTILLWELPPSHRPPPAAPLSAEQLEGLWADLAKPDAVKAFAAVDALAAQPGLSLPLLCQRLKPATVPADRIRRLISDLDSDQFTRREAATKELRALGELAEPGLRKALAKPSSLEVRRRIEQLLPIPPRELSSEELRGLRALRVLTQADTPEARRVLESLAQGAPEARLTQEAKAALERLNNRPAASR